ncbi:hypothetical protein LZL87_012748 [Fusarium oxysporum]|nr:hypothetical protein LZL87_012748 [Fusarium oxysporum]
MSAQGQVRSVKHGSIGEVEAGKGVITRYADGRPTRFTFKTKFDRVPHVQITPIFIDPKSAFKNFWIYHLAPSGDQAVDESGFYLGCCDVEKTSKAAKSLQIEISIEAMIEIEHRTVLRFANEVEPPKELERKGSRSSMAEAITSLLSDTGEEEDVGEISYLEIEAGFPIPARAIFTTNGDSHGAAKTLLKPQKRRASGPTVNNRFSYRCLY